MIKIPFINDREVPKPVYGRINNAGTMARTNIITTDNDLKNTETYKKTVVEIEKIIMSGLPILGQGLCISVSDVIMQILRNVGITCQMIEVQASIKNKIKNTVELLGYDDNLANRPVSVDTHVVVLVSGEINFFIDGSIGHLLPKQNGEVIIDKVIGKEEFAIIDNDKIFIVYQIKPKSKLPSIHQNSIINRIETDKEIFKNISLLKKLNYIGITLSLFAVINVLLKAFGFWSI